MQRTVRVGKLASGANLRITWYTFRGSLSLWASSSCARKRVKVADLVLLHCCASLLGRFIVIGSQGLRFQWRPCLMSTISRASCCFCRTRAKCRRSQCWLASPTSARWSGKVPEPDLKHSVFDRVEGLHRRETTQFLEEVLLQIILELKGQNNKRVTRNFSSIITRAFPIFPRSQSITEFRAVPRRLSLNVPLSFDCSRHRNHHDQWTMVTKSTASHWGFINGAGWRGRGSKSDIEVANPVSTTLRMLPCPLFSTAGSEGVLQFPTIVFGQGVEFSSIFGPSAHVRRPRATFATCPNPRQ